MEYSPLALIIIVLTGSITAFFAATSGLVQNDIKRIIAFSTISQLGYMVAAVGQHYIFFLRPTINSLYAGNF